MAKRDPHFARTTKTAQEMAEERDYCCGECSDQGYSRKAIPGRDIDFASMPLTFTWDGAPSKTDTQRKITEACDAIKALLLAKNQQYGDSALNPVRIFSSADPVEQLKVRIDDKLSRLSRGDASLESDEEILNDLIGYLVLLKVARHAE